MAINWTGWTIEPGSARWTPGPSPWRASPARPETASPSARAEPTKTAHCVFGPGSARARGLKCYSAAQPRKKKEQSPYARRSGQRGEETGRLLVQSRSSPQLPEHAAARARSSLGSSRLARAVLLAVLACGCCLSCCSLLPMLGGHCCCDCQLASSPSRQKRLVGTSGRAWLGLARVHFVIAAFSQRAEKK